MRECAHYSRTPTPTHCAPPTQDLLCRREAHELACGLSIGLHDTDRSEMAGAVPISIRDSVPSAREAVLTLIALVLEFLEAAALGAGDGHLVLLSAIRMHRPGEGGVRKVVVSPGRERAREGEAGLRNPSKMKGGGGGAAAVAAGGR